MTSTRRTAATVVTTALLLLLTGCGGTSPTTSPTSHSAPSKDSGTHTMGDGTTMSDSEMQHMGDSETSGSDEERSAPGQVSFRGAGPSQPAGMICSLEIARAVQRTFALRAVPTARDGWSDQTYTCTYQLPGSTLRLSVKDLDRDPAGRTYFETLRRTIPTARTIRGLQGLGFPALTSSGPVGQVAFLKDHKTLVVDAGSVSRSDLPPGFSRSAAAYGVAAAVIACWKE